MEQSLSDFFNSKRFQKLKRNLKAIENQKKKKQYNSQVHKQAEQANKDIKNLEKKIFKQMSIPKSIYNGRN